MNPIDAAAEKRAVAHLEAADQAADNDSFLGETIYTTKTGEKFEIPLLDLLDDDQQERFNKVQHEFNSCDPAPSIKVPATTVTKDGTTTATEAYEIPGGLLVPYQKDGVLLEPPHSVQLVEALLGEDYPKFKAAKGNSNEFLKKATELRDRIREREASDPKSDVSAEALAHVSD